MQLITISKIGGSLIMAAPIEWDEEHDTNGRSMETDAVNRMLVHVSRMLDERAERVTRDAGLDYVNEPHRHLDQLAAVFRPERPKALWQAPGAER